MYCDGVPGDKRLDSSPDECRVDQVPVDTECRLSCGGHGFQLVGDDTRVCQFHGDIAAWQPEQWPSCVGSYIITDISCYKGRRERERER